MTSCPDSLADARMPMISSRSDRGKWYVERWAAIYLKNAQERLQRQLNGYNLTIEDTYVLQQMCAYEVRI